MTLTLKIIVFSIATAGMLWVSRSSLRNLEQHGFYRFFSWEVILVLFLVNMDSWFVDPFSLRQLFSWGLLMLSLVLILSGVLTFRSFGKLDQGRGDPGLVGIEKTTTLVTQGIYRYIRHPFYSSLLFLGWGIFMKQISWFSLFLAIINSALLLITAKKEEAENILFFGEGYEVYMSGTKMFIPFLF
mgnify:CR=1 FL=1